MGELIKFIPRHVNGIKVEQRSTDGFINGTTMCTAYNREISNWLKRDDTWELVVALANNLGISPNSSKRTNSDKTRVSSTYPTLVVVKRGSPEFGGGTWIHHDLAVDLAGWCYKPFAIQVGRWVREWFLTGTNPVQSDIGLDQEILLWQQRHDIRVYLKDFLRPDLMASVVAHALKSGVSPIRLCSDVHDAINQRVQGMKSKDIKTLNGLPLGELIRDFFETTPLLTYAAINKLAKNRIEDFGIEPVQAVHDACDMYLGAAYQPEPLKFTENIHLQERRLQKARLSRSLPKYTQLSLLHDDEAV